MGITFKKFVILFALFNYSTHAYYFQHNTEHQVDDFNDIDTIFAPDDDIINVRSKHDEDEIVNVESKHDEDEVNEDKPQYIAQPISNRNSKCELITLKQCKTPDVKYNYTIFPNAHNHKSQTEAAEALLLFSVLIQSQCSVYTRLFLCSEFLPMCALRPIRETNIYVEEALKPCKSMCLHVKNKCEILMLSVGIKWPDMLSCERLPENEMCIKPPLSSSSSASSSSNNNIEFEDYLQAPYENNMNKFLNHIRNKNLFPKTETSKMLNKKLKKTTQNFRLENNITTINSDSSLNTNYCLNRKYFLPSSFLLNTQQILQSYAKSTAATLKLNQSISATDAINKEKLTQCVPICNQDILFDRNEKKFTEKCSFILAIICFIITFLILLLYMFFSKKFQYPEHIIVTISFCYNMYSIPYLFRYFVGHQKISCENYNYNVNIDNIFDALFYPSPSTTTTTTTIIPSLALDRTAFVDESYVLVKESLENTWCTITFIFTYYFQSASTIWWVILTFIWFLISNRRYSIKLFSKLNGYYHLVAWTIPTLLTIIALIWKRIDADELTGMCSIGNQDTHALLVLVIIPYSVYFFLGLIFIVGGFIGIYRVKERPKLVKEEEEEQEIQAEGFKPDLDENKEDVYNIENIERILFKIGIFAIIYVIPIIYLILSNIYHYLNYNVWYVNKISLTTNNDAPNPASEVMMPSYPITEIYIFKLFISFIMGISTFLWIFSSNACKSLFKVLRDITFYCLYCNTTVKTITDDKNNSYCNENNASLANVKLQNSSVLMEYNKLRQIQQQQCGQHICLQPCFHPNIVPAGQIDETFLNSSNQMQFRNSFVRTPIHFNYQLPTNQKLSSF